MDPEIEGGSERSGRGYGERSWGDRSQGGGSNWGDRCGRSGGGYSGGYGDGRGQGGSSGGSSSSAGYAAAAAEPMRASVSVRGFKFGHQSVVHAKIGEGLIQALVGTGGDARARINFRLAGVKELLLTVTKLAAV